MPCKKQTKKNTWIFAYGDFLCIFVVELLLYSLEQSCRHNLEQDTKEIASTMVTGKIQVPLGKVPEGSSFAFHGKEIPHWRCIFWFFFSEDFHCMFVYAPNFVSR